MRKRNFLNLFALVLLASCGITVPNTKVCTVAGVLTAGATCAYTLSSRTETMTFEEYMEFLEPSFETPTSPARPGAFCQSAVDWNKQKTALEQACRKLGKRCSYDLQQAIKQVNSNIQLLERKALKLY